MKNTHGGVLLFSMGVLPNLAKHHIYPRSKHEDKLQQLEQKEEVLDQQKIQLVAQAKDEGTVVFFIKHFCSKLDCSREG